MQAQGWTQLEVIDWISVLPSLAGKQPLHDLTTRLAKQHVDETESPASGVKIENVVPRTENMSDDGYRKEMT